MSNDLFDEAHRVDRERREFVIGRVDVLFQEVLAVLFERLGTRPVHRESGLRIAEKGKALLGPKSPGKLAKQLTTHEGHPAGTWELEVLVQAVSDDAGVVKEGRYACPIRVVVESTGDLAEFRCAVTVGGTSFVRQERRGAATVAAIAEDGVAGRIAEAVLGVLLDRARRVWPYGD